MKVKELIGPRPFPLIIYHIKNLAQIGSGLFRRFPLRTQNIELSCKPFFILGSGRSGNTLLRAILSQNKEVCIPPESYVLGSVIRNFQFYNFLPWNVLARLVISEFESFHQFYTWDINLRDFYQIAVSLPREQQNLAKLLDLFYLYYAKQKCPAARRWGDKTPINTFSVSMIDQVFPDAQYIHIIRDGRDVVASYIKSGLYHDVRQASMRWLRSVETAQSFGSKLASNRYLELYYEELVRSPVTTLERVSAFLSIGFTSEMLQFWKNVDNLGDTLLPHHNNLKNPINLDSLGKWKTQLSREEQRLVETLLNRKLLAMNYPT